MDPFERLPPELIRLILLHIADFASVQTILSASPWVNSVFHARPRTLILDLVASNPITAVPEIQKLFQGIALIHSPFVHCASLDDYLDMTRKNTPSDILSQHLSETEQSQMVQIAARIQHLACICLSTMQRNFVSALEASATGPLSAAVSPQKASRPFSWIEEYRVYWALWHLQHYSDLRKAVEGQTGARDKTSRGCRWSWPANSIERLHAYPLWNGIRIFTVEIIWAVAAVLADLGLHPSYGHSEEQPQQESTRAAWSYPESTPLPFFASFELPRHTESNCSLFWCPPPAPEETRATVFWQLAPTYRKKLPGQIRLFRSYARMFRQRSQSQSLGMLQIQPYRRFGAHLWDMWRMKSVGLCKTSSRISTPDGGILEPSESNTIEIGSRWLALIGEK